MTNAPPPVIDPPPALELLQLVADFLTQELAPAQQDAKLRVRTLVAANIVRMARRELEGRGALETDPDGYAVPAELIARFGSLRALAEELSSGRRSIVEPDTFAVLLRHVEAKLAIAAPEAPNPSRE